MILIDWSPISIASAFMCNEELSEDLYRHLVLNSVLSYRKKFKKYGQTVIVFDDKNYWRKDIFPAYKGNREKTRSVSKLDFEKFYKYQNTIKAEFSEIFPWRFIQIPRLEADDIIGHIALTAKEESVIISPDGDFKQCMRNPRIKVFSNQTKKFAPDETLYEVEYNLHRKIMRGDSGDNINNVLTDLNFGGRQKQLRETLIEHTYEVGLAETIKERYEENKKLIDLRMIPEEYKKQIEESLNSPIGGSKGKVWNYLTSKKLNRIGSFISEIEDLV